MKHLSSLRGLDRYLCMLFILLAFSFQSFNAQAQEWTIYDPSLGQLPDAATPAWSASGGNGDNGAGGESWSLIDDPDSEGDKLLQFISLGDNTSESHSPVFQTQVFDPAPAGATAAIRAKFLGDAQRVIEVDLQLALRDQLRIESGKISLQRSGASIDAASLTGWDPSEWNTYRITLDAGTGAVKVYLNENSTPILDVTTATSSGNNRIRIGDGASSNTYASLVDWVVYDISGTYSPEQSPLPDFGGEEGPSDVATLSDLTVDDATVASFSSVTFSYDVILPSDYEGLPIVDASTTDINASYDVTQATEIPGSATVTVTAEDTETQETYTINFTKAAEGVKLIGYVYKSISTDADAAMQEEDPIIQMLDEDENFIITPLASTGSNVIDLSTYDLVIVQESFGSGDAILKRDGSLGLGNIAVPFIYNKTYALRDGKAIDETSAIAAVAESTDLGVSVAASEQSHEIFSGIDFSSDNVVSVYKSGAGDNGGVGNKSLNPLKRLKLSTEATLLATAGTVTDYDSSILINDIPAGTQFGDNALDVTQARMIAFAFNYGAMIKNKGTNITAEGLTLWRNAVYSLLDMEMPTTLVTIPSDVSSLSDITVNGTSIEDFDAETLTYDVVLPAGTSAVPTVVGTKSDANASATVSNAASLPGTSTITVKAENDFDSTIYTLNFTVYLPSDNALLSDLAVDGTSITGFSSTTVSYQVELAEGTTTAPTVTATADNDSASVAITAATALPGSTTVVVTAEDGSTTKTYTINFTVSTGEPTLSNVDPKNSVSVYPNPVINTAVIEAAFPIKRVEIFGLNGQLLNTQWADNQKQISVDMTNLNSGIYLLKVVLSDNTIIDYKIIR